MDVAQSKPQGAHYHADIIYLLSLLGLKKGARNYDYTKLSSHQHSLDADGQHTLAFYIKHVPPVGLVVVIVDEASAPRASAPLPGRW